MNTVIEQNLAKRLTELLSDPNYIDEPEMSKCRDIYAHLRDRAEFGGLRSALDRMCDTEKLFPGRIYPSYQDVRDILFGDPELILTFIDRYNLLCVWRISLKAQSSGCLPDCATGQ